nr:cytochrome P450 [Tanacetum cinerariifolium]
MLLKLLKLILMIILLDEVSAAGDIFKIVTTAVHSGTVRVLSVVGTTRIVTVEVSVCNLIEEKLKIIPEKKVKLEDCLRKANIQFSNDEDVYRLYEKYGGVFKETILLKEEQVYVDDFHLGDGENVKTDVAGEMQTLVEAEDVIEDVVIKHKKRNFKKKVLCDGSKRTSTGSER